MTKENEFLEYTCSCGCLSAIVILLVCVLTIVVKITWKVVLW
jgi:hypothetical protein